jgi:hypothetical protein
MGDVLTEADKRKLEYKKHSRKWLVAKYAMVFAPLSIVAQIVLSYMGGPSLPLTVIVGGCFSLIGLYFGVNLVQKGVVGDKNPHSG